MVFFISYSFSFPIFVIYLLHGPQIVAPPVQHTKFCSIESIKELTYPHCFSPTCGLEFEFESFGCECTQDDIATHTTPCDPLTKTRGIFFYWKPPATCRSNNFTLPEPVLDVPCDLVCQTGEFLRIINDDTLDDDAHLQCTKCPIGRYSVGGGIQFEPPWLGLPPQFETECSYWVEEDKHSHKPCSPWTTTHGYLMSGDNFDNMGISTRLWLNIDLLIEGSVTFFYKYEGEKEFDTFYFEVDGKVLLEIKESQKEWFQVHFPLSVGHHLLQWVYKKDTTSSKGIDKVFIRSVKIMGIRQNDLECISCPPGRYAHTEGNQECVACAAGHYTKEYESTSCKVCHTWEKSKMGAAQCSPALDCTEYDLAEIEGHCFKNGNMTVSHPWLQPMECADGNPGSFPTPPPFQDLCEPTVCMNGQTFVEKPVAKCKACPPGEGGGGIFTCKKCSAGTGSGGYMRYTSYWGLHSIGQSNFMTHCLGDCATDGWRSGGRFVDSGAGHGTSAESSLTMNIDPVEDPTPEVLFFTYTLSCMKDTAFLLIFFDGSLVKKLHCENDCDQSKKEVAVLLPKHTRPMDFIHTITWTYKKVSQGAINHACDSARIYKVTTRGYSSLEFKGYASGGSLCENCSPGFFSIPPGICYSCGPGKFSDGKKNLNCKKCQGNSFTHRQGSKECISCGNGTIASKDHSQCLNTCKFNLMPTFRSNNAKFDLTHLAETIFGPIHVGYNQSLVYYISICKTFSIISNPPPECLNLIDEGWRTIHPKWEGHNKNHPLAFPIFACAMNQEKILNTANLGAVVSYHALTNASIVGFQLRLEHGAKLRCVDDSGNIMTAKTSTIIEFICSETGTVQPVDVNPVYTSGISLVRCQTVFEWPSLYGCPLCQSTDWTSSDEICNRDTQKKMRTFHWKEPKQCARGIDLPPSVIEDCEPVITVSDDDFIVPVSHVWLIVMGSLIATILGCGAIVYLCFEHRRIYSKYRQLQENIEPDGIVLEEINNNSSGYQMGSFQGNEGDDF